MGEFFWARFPNARLNTIRFSLCLCLVFDFGNLAALAWTLGSWNHCRLLVAFQLRARRISQAIEAQTLAMLCQCFVIQTESFDFARPSFYWFLATSKESGKTVCQHAGCPLIQLAVIFTNSHEIVAWICLNSFQESRLKIGNNFLTQSNSVSMIKIEPWSKLWHNDCDRDWVEQPGSLQTVVCDWAVRRTTSKNTNQN